MSWSWVNDGQAVLMVLGRSAPDKSPRTYGGAPILAPSSNSGISDSPG